MIVCKTLQTKDTTKKDATQKRHTTLRSVPLFSSSPTKSLQDQPCSQGLLDTHPLPAASVSSHIARRVLRLAPWKSSRLCFYFLSRTFDGIFKVTSFSSTGRPPASHRRSLCSELRLRVKGWRGLQARYVLENMFIQFDQYVSRPDVFTEVEQSQKPLAVIPCQTSAHTRLERETSVNNFLSCFLDIYFQKFLVSHLTMLLMQWSEREGTAWSSSQ